MQCISSNPVFFGTRRMAVYSHESCCSIHSNAKDEMMREVKNLRIGLKISSAPFLVLMLSIRSRERRKFLHPSWKEINSKSNSPNRNFENFSCIVFPIQYGFSLHKQQELWWKHVCFTWHTSKSASFKSNYQQWFKCDTILKPRLFWLR